MFLYLHNADRDQSALHFMPNTRTILYIMLPPLNVIKNKFLSGWQ